MLQCLLTFKFYIIIRKTIIMNKKSGHEDSGK